MVAAAVAGPLLLAAVAAHGSVWVDAAVFGIDAAQLHTLAPQIQRVPKPVWGPGGTRGLWAAPDATLAGHTFAVLYFFRRGQLQQIEHTWSSDEPACRARAVYGDVVADLSAQWGPAETTTDNAQGPAQDDSTLWGANGTDLIAYVLDTGQRCSVRVVNRARQLKDASEL